MNQDPNKDYWQTSDLAGRVICAGADVTVLQAYIQYERELETQPGCVKALTEYAWEIGLAKHGKLR